ncbi:Hypothetical protein HEAR1247 [Herminiimonas arsenicoxydans]|uniref:Uncharacterized protein n=1 Tax=Herminiimonas arsenicoxydans TaxID=204773 RepID=A4G4I5_HERAR|nr:Hypothetical protein HEAR1247 [Herminiimonas arsenicoxydans]
MHPPLCDIAHRGIMRVFLLLF